MKNLVLALVVALAFCPIAMAGDIAVSTQGGWMSQGHADNETQEIANNVTGASLELFASDQQDALADWVVAHTGNGQADLLVLFGIFPDSIYPAGNAQPEGSLAELFLDDGNIIINTGDYIFYVGSAGNNNQEGLMNMSDTSASMWGDDTTTFAPTTEGHAIAPSLTTLNCNRPLFPAQFDGTDWEVELVLAQNGDGSQVHPAILHNTVTDGRLGVFFQRSDDNQPRGEVISEWINNWYLTGGVIPNGPAWKPDPVDGAIDSTSTALSWTTGYGAVKHRVYLSTDETIDDADLVGETEANLTVQPVPVDPGTTYYWRIDEVAADDSVVEGDVWMFSTLPLEAHFPVPADGASNIISLNELSWTAGKDAVFHNVSFGTNPDALAPLSMMKMEKTVAAPALEPATTYYWSVTEVTPAGQVAGPVWSLSTLDPDAVTPSGMADMIVQFDLDEDASSLTALDTSGNGHHAPLVGDAKLGGGVLSLDGNGDAANAGSDPSFNPAGGFSISARVKMTGWGGDWGNAIAGTRGENNLGWQLRRHSSNHNLTFTVRGTPGADDPRGTIVPPLNEWINVAAVFDPDGGTRTVYINGIVDVQIADSNSVAASDHNLYIGARSNGGNNGSEANFNGQIDYVHIINRALTFDEVRAMHADLALPWNASPANGASNQTSDTILSWNPGEGAVEQDVYFGLDSAAVAAADVTDNTGIYQGRQVDTTFAPALTSGATHYWRVDQVQADGTIITGAVWRFSVARLVPASANLGACKSGIPGFSIYAFKPQDSAGWGYNALNEILDTGLLNGVGVTEEGTRIDEFVNMRDTGNGAFGGDKSFPGIDPFEEPAADPAAGDDDNNYGAEVLGCIELTAGIHRIGANSDDGTIVWIGGVEIGRSEEWKGASNRDFTFEVEEDGAYALKARWMEGGGGSSLELHEILADGTRILLNDVASGGSAVFVPAEPLISSVVRSGGVSGDRDPVGAYDGSTAPLATEPGGLKDGNMVFSDRTYPWAGIPAEYEGTEYIRTFNSDKNGGTVDVKYEVTISRDAIVWVTIDDRIPAEWNAGGAIASQQDAADYITAASVPAGTFTDSGIDIYVREKSDGSTDRPMSVFVAELPAGTYVFTSMDSGKNFYSIGAIE